MHTSRPWIAVVLAVAALRTHAADLDLKLEVKELWGKPGPRHVSGGVPLLPGQASEASQFRLGTREADGKFVAVPAQFKVLARWWRQDNSIRWVLVDFATDVQANKAKTFYLTASANPVPQPASKLAVTESADRIEITTGPGRFVLNRKCFAFLDKAFVDANGDGQFADTENLLEGSPDLGVVIEDTYGERYYSSEGTRSVEVIEQGPVRVCVRARGTNKARGGKGYSRGMYSYDCFLNFYADNTDVYADLILGNNPAKSIGSPTFEDASLLFKLAGGEPEFWLQGEKNTEGRLSAAESVCLYQDSNGADTWESCQGYDGDDQDDGWNFPKGVTTSFRGFRLLKRAAGREEAAGSGDHARGLLRLNTKRGGVVVHTKYFWQQFPKAAEVFGDGRVRVALFPREQKVPHFLEDTTAKGHEIVLHFYAPGKPGPYPADGSGRPQPEAVAGCWDSRVLPRPAIEHMAAAGALADLGPFTVPNAGMDKRPDTRTCLEGPRMFELDDLYGNSFGWQVFGERWRSQGGSGRQGARQPMDEDDYLRRWYVTGVRDWFVVGDARSRQFRDVRGYRVEDQDPFGFADWMDFRKANASEFRVNRPQPTDEEYKKYTQGIWPRCAFWLPNPEHNTLDLLYDRYLLFGDVRSMENMKVIAAHGGYFAGYQTPVVTRDRGWGWRSLDRYWELTGDKDAERLMRQVIKNQSALIGKAPLICGTPDNPNWWFTAIFSRAVAMSALHTGDPTVLELAKTMAIGKEGKEKNVTALFAVLYHLTGEEKYKTAVLKPGKGEGTLSVGGYLYICDHWLLNQPPRAKTR